APDGPHMSIKTERVRDAVRDIAGRPFEGRARAFVIDEAHLLTEQAQNALLKSLEEPPPSSHVILVTASPQALLPTIRSRCQTLRFSPLPEPLLEAHLRDRCGLPPAEAQLRSALCGGSLGVALAFESEAWRAPPGGAVGRFGRRCRGGGVARPGAPARPVAPGE